MLGPSGFNQAPQQRAVADDPIAIILTMWNAGEKAEAAKAYSAQFGGSIAEATKAMRAISASA